VSWGETSRSTYADCGDNQTMLDAIELVSTN
jgi:hypothetical protein